MFCKDNKNDFQEFTNKKEFDKQMKLIESSPSFQGKCDQIITEADKECENFIEEASQNKKLELKKFATRHIVHRSDMTNFTEFQTEEQMNEAVNSIAHLQTLNVLIKD